ncbi:diphosphomevalonate decarboxylase [Allomyces arbusculus]|nr:diphosphomevalonate decarboxylase [Allomyces arbusculus]
MATPATPSAAAYEATVTAPVNIAVIKYWGKRDESLILPTNSSLSATLSQDILHSKTTARADPSFTGADTLWLNGVPEPMSASKRLANVVTALRAKRAALEASDSSLPKMSKWIVHVVSENNFPTAAGLASSASGFAALVFALANLYQLPEAKDGESGAGRSTLSALARLGSGSACRSLFGGFVAWEMGAHADGRDSVAVPVAPATHWTDLEALVLVVHDGRKGVSSTSGMQTTVKTSALAQERFKSVVPQRMFEMKQAILRKDFDKFAETTMMDSNQFHAICLDTFPPIFYLNDVSRAIIQLVTDFNATPLEGYTGKYKVAYTYDAGPNAVLYLPRRFVRPILALIQHYFPAPTDIAAADYFADPYKVAATYPAPISTNVADLAHTKLTPHAPGAIKRILHAKVGDGPRVVYAGPASDAGETGLMGKDGTPVKK